MYMKSVCFSTFIPHISGTDRCKIGVRYLIFRPVIILLKKSTSFIMVLTSKFFNLLLQLQSVKIPLWSNENNFFIN
jgi:hypothetical protein